MQWIQTIVKKSTYSEVFLFKQLWKIKSMNMHKQKRIYIACILEVVSVFLQWKEHSLKETITSLHPGVPVGKIILILYTIPLIITFLKDKSKVLSLCLLYREFIYSVISSIVRIINVCLKEINNESE